jgi:hypothetical protein
MYFHFIHRTGIVKESQPPAGPAGIALAAPPCGVPPHRGREREGEGESANWQKEKKNVERPTLNFER